MFVFTLCGLLGSPSAAAELQLFLLGYSSNDVWCVAGYLLIFVCLFVYWLEEEQQDQRDPDQSKLVFQLQGDRWRVSWQVQDRVSNSAGLTCEKLTECVWCVCRTSPGSCSGWPTWRSGTSEGQRSVSCLSTWLCSPSSPCSRSPKTPSLSCHLRSVTFQFIYILSLLL